MPDGTAIVPFVVLAAAVLAGAVMVIASRSVVHAAFWLLEVMMAIAGLFMLLSAGFLALVQVMVYAGAVSVLLLFTIMLTLRRREDSIRPLDLSWSAAGIALAVLVASGAAISSFKPVIAKMPAVTPGIAEFGALLFTKWALPFEIASVVLLIALVGAVWWSGGDGE
ncbi:MAG: NADH-quinone oxidoreductase subunit J [Coriobacteriia bacterium]|nr:NADH-quinone oxidoreductase subunit J [Coriobacteriia bacterium]